ncbi:hypothetical protein DICSQDRAFT_130729 [Dichomitus squalens LYAD-421 SS1]|uniref:uncharacterized protein n=1 Tax=Dichomitus squalens (strain LYAD-421) TaxID=732165 RepID=UPI000441595B|nr:uncharacterized protein DICSQDRAFT_130729 [Dichomitus squalens LYAD-421 SS1]EJF66460.1 hypothetical protein DICSQDRAFT_130729 [Dichomitus squalens LYAD-421 SS1]
MGADLASLLEELIYRHRANWDPATPSQENGDRSQVVQGELPQIACLILDMQIIWRDVVDRVKKSEEPSMAASIDVGGTTIGSGVKANL